MQFDRPFELEEPHVERLMSHLTERRRAYERFSGAPRGGSYQARMLLDSICGMIRTLRLTVPFRTGSHRLEQYLIAQLRNIADALSRLPALRVMIEGHTDVRGARRFNRKLALARANAVRAVLIEAGVDPDRVVARAYGVEGATYPNGDRGGYAFDRKVIIRFAMENDASWEA